MSDLDQIIEKARLARGKSTVDRYSYCQGLLMAAKMCERPVRPYDSEEIVPASPIHARSIRLLVEAHYDDQTMWGDGQ